MMGIPCDQLSHIYGDNQSVLATTMMPDSTLKKKSQSMTYHFVHEGSIHGEWRTAYVNTHDSEANLLTKFLPVDEKRWNFIRNLLHHISSGKGATMAIPYEGLASLVAHLDEWM